MCSRALRRRSDTSDRNSFTQKSYPGLQLVKPPESEFASSAAGAGSPRAMEAARPGRDFWATSMQLWPDRTPAGIIRLRRPQSDDPSSPLDRSEPDTLLGIAQWRHANDRQAPRRLVLR